MIEMKTLKGTNNKAQIIRYDNEVYLKSYDTLVCKVVEDEISKQTNFIKLDRSNSNTTMSHINNFRNIYGWDNLTQKEWDMIELGECRKRDSIELEFEELGYNRVALSNGAIVEYNHTSNENNYFIFNSKKEEKSIGNSTVTIEDLREINRQVELLSWKKNKGEIK